MRRNAYLETKITCRHRDCGMTFDEPESSANGPRCPECGKPVHTYESMEGNR